MTNDSDPISGGLVSLEGLTKPATVLIEKISDAIGTLHRPRQIVREARAEAEADKIRALANIEITEIQRRGMIRFIEQQGKQQENFENVVAQAIPELKESAKPDEIDNDWMMRFFEASKLVSDKEMQSLWARLLAGEANKAGTFSKRTIDQVSNLERRDAQLFTNLCMFAWNAYGLAPLILDVDDEIYNDELITFDTLTHLDNIGLITFDALSGFERTKLPQIARFRYYGTPIIVERPSPATNLELGHVILTAVGTQLAPISGSVGKTEFLEYVIKKWIDSGFKVWSLLSDTKPHATTKV